MQLVNLGGRQQRCGRAGPSARRASVGRRCRLSLLNAASSTPGQSSTSSKGGVSTTGATSGGTASATIPSGVPTLVRSAAQLTAKERRVLVESVSGVLPLPQLQNSGAAVAKEPCVWCFSYGGNMSFEMLSKREVSVLARDPAFVVDPRVRLVFKHRGGQATLETLAPGAEPRFRPLGASQGQPCVHGVLYRMPASALRQLHSRGQGYVLTEVEVETYDGQRVAAHVFVSGALAKLPQEVVPPESYMRKLREGASFNFLDPVYQAWLSSIETVPSAGLGAEYFSTPGRYISYSLLLMSLVVVGGYLTQHW